MTLTTLSDILFNNSAYTPKAPEINTSKSFIINKNEEEKINKDNEKYIDCLNNQTYKLDSQIDQLQNKVFELNIQNIKIEKDKKKLKNYEKIIEMKKNKNKKAEKTIFKLNNEAIDYSFASCSAFFLTSSIVPTLKNAASGYSSISPLRIALNPLIVSSIGT